MHRLEDVGHIGMKMAEVEEGATMTEGVDMTGVKSMKNGIK